MRLADEVRPGATARLLTDWVQLGLIGAPSRQALGRGKGSSRGTWSQNQKDLFLTVWTKRKEAPIRDLCNIPVYLWVWWGDQYAALSQVKRSMATWCSRQEASEEAAYTVADKLLTDLGQTKLPGAVRDLLAQALRGKRPDIDQLRASLSRVVERTVDVAVGSVMPIDMGADKLVELLVARMEAIEHLRTVPDATWEWARFTQLRGTVAYARDQPNLATHTQFGRFFTALDHDTLVARACVMLLTTVGMALVGTVGLAGTLDDPVFWHEHGMKGTVSNTRLHAHGIALSFSIRQER